MSVKASIVQCSVVGPYLFALLINCLRAYVINSEFLLFADDSRFLLRVNAHGHSLLNDDLQWIIAWSILHGLPLIGVK